MNILKNNITMIRGDSETITISLKTSKGIKKSLITGDTIYFTLKKSVNDQIHVLQKVVTEFKNGAAIISLTPSDTSSLPLSIFTYDIRLKFSDGTVKTIVPSSSFSLKNGSSI